jgi:NADPH-dependent curcumin reductase CurA
MPTNTAVRLASRPNGMPDDSTWAVTTDPTPDLDDGQFLVRVDQVSLDPAMRGWLDDRPSYVPPVAIGDVMRAGAVGVVEESRHRRFPVGSQVVGTFGVQQYAVSSGAGVERIDPGLGTPGMYLGVLGITGLTAYYGLFKHGRPRAGETVLVSAAAGAVGSVVSQLARLNGCRVVGIAGGPEKCAYLVDTLHVDEAVDYRSGSVRKAIAGACPDGIDVYFDNVGGPILDAALANLAFGARVVICGAISQYNETERAPGPANYMSLLVRRATMEGFLYFDNAADFPVARRRLAGWVSSGALTAPETLVSGTVADFPAVFLRLFSGDNLGKLILDLTERT